MIITIQYLRGIAALLVVLRHISFKDNQYGSGLFNFTIGDIGVDIFFVISGFIMYYMMSEKKNGFRMIIVFLKHRIIRVIPLYWALTSFGFLVYLLIPNSFSRTESPSILGSYFLLPNTEILLDPAWTLSYEFYFYFIFSIGLLFIRSRILIIVSVLFILSLIGFIMEIDKDNRILLFLTNSLLLEFLYGILISYIFLKIKLEKQKRLIFSGIAFCLFILLVIMYDMGYKSELRGLDLGLPSMFLVFSFVLLENEIKKYKLIFLEMLGNASYSLYLVHAFVLAVMGVIYRKLGIESLLIESIYLIFMLIVSLLIGYLTYIFIEQKLTNSLRKKFH